MNRFGVAMLTVGWLACLAVIGSGLYWIATGRGWWHWPAGLGETGRDFYCLLLLALHAAGIGGFCMITTILGSERR